MKRGEWTNKGNVLPQGAPNTLFLFLFLDISADNSLCKLHILPHEKSKEVLLFTQHPRHHQGKCTAPFALLSQQLLHILPYLISYVLLPRTKLTSWNISYLSQCVKVDHIS